MPSAAASVAIIIVALSRKYSTNAARLSAVTEPVTLLLPLYVQAGGKDSEDSDTDPSETINIPGYIENDYGYSYEAGTDGKVCFVKVMIADYDEFILIKEFFREAKAAFVKTDIKLPEDNMSNS